MSMSTARRTRRKAGRIAALATSAALAAGALLALPAAAAPAQAADAFRITPNPAAAGESFEGWGTSLVWFANATGNYPEALREELYQKVADGSETRRVLDSNSRKDYRQQLEKELKEVAESEMWKAGTVVRSLRPERAAKSQG